MISNDKKKWDEEEEILRDGKGKVRGKKIRKGGGWS